MSLINRLEIAILRYRMNHGRRRWIRPTLLVLDFLGRVTTRGPR
jgi:hypothetical protein